MKISRAVLGTALLALLAGGCFATNPDGPETRGLGDPVASTTVEGALSASDVAIDPGSGNLVTMGSDYGSVIVVERGTGVIVESFPTSAYGSSVGMVAAGVVVLSDGSWTHTRIDLSSGETLTVNGLEDLSNRTPAFLDGSAASGGESEGDMVSIECEPRSGSPIEMWGGEGENRTRVDSIPLRANISSVRSVAYAPERGLIYVLSDRGIISLNAGNGELEQEFEGTENDWDIAGLAWDGANGRLLVSRSDWNTGAARIDEYEL